MAHLGSPHAAVVDVVFINWSIYSIFSDLLIHILPHQTQQVYTCQLLFAEFTGIQQRTMHVLCFSFKRCCADVQSWIVKTCRRSTNIPLCRWELLLANVAAQGRTSLG